MSTFEALLGELSRRRIRIWEKAGELRYKAPPNVLTADLRRLLVEHSGSLLAQLRTVGTDGSHGALERTSGTPAGLPLTELQRAYWLAEQDADGGTAGYWFNEYRVDDLDYGRLRACWQRLVSRHDALRVVIGRDGFQQVLDRETPCSIAFEDLRPMTPQAAAEHMAAVRERWRSPRAALTDWPLIDMLVQRTRDDWRILAAGRFLVIDMMAYDQLCQELAILYANPDAVLPPLLQSYRGAVLDQVESESTQAHQDALAWWLVRDLPDPPDLPLRAGFDRDARRRFERKNALIDSAELALLTEHCRSFKVTLNTILMTAYGEVLANWAREPHFTINLLLSRSKPRPQNGGAWPLSNAAGTMLLEVDCRPDEDFATRAARLQSRLADDLGRAGDVSGSTVIRERAKRLGRPAAPNPFVFASVVGMETDLAGRYGLERLGWQPVHNYIQTPQVLLDQQVFGRPEGLVFNWDYAEGAFEPGVIDHAFAAYRDLLRDLCRSTAAWGRKTTIGLPPAQSAVRAAANATTTEAENGCLHDFVAALESSAATALVDGDWRLTYGELIARARGVAKALEQVAGRSPVPVIASGATQAIATLGVLLTGRAFVPLDTDAPGVRLAEIMHQVEPEVVLGNRAATATKIGPASWITIEDIDPVTPSLHREAAVDPRGLAYLIFTSGSTGVPKGVAIQHQAARNTIDAMLRLWPLSGEDAVLAVSRGSFDLSIYDRFALFAAGGKVVFPAEANPRDPAHWCRLIVSERVTVWNSVPALAEILVDYAEMHRLRLPLRLILLSGDWVPRSLPQRLQSVAPGCTIIALGGATEASIWSNFFDVRALDQAWPSVPYGAPLANQTLHVLDHHLEDRPDFCEGDLFIGGAGLALQYWRDPEKTRASFIIHPRSGQRLYRTGDRARYWSDGTVEFLGRRDAQVKIRGHRIELGEIEAALQAFPGVRAAAALMVGAGAAQNVAAAVVVELELEPRLPELRRFLRQRLPEHMIPRSIVSVPRLPLSANGKLDRKALRSVLAGRTETRIARTPPEGPVEHSLFDVWRAVLGHDDFGCTDSFFAVGGDSVAVIRMINALDKAGIGSRLPMSAVMNAPTIRELAVVLARCPGDTSDERLVHRFSAARSGALICCLPPIGGTVFAYRALAQRLGSANEVVGLSAVGVLGGSPDLSVADMASRYLRIVATMPRWQDRLVLVGWSFGGVVALEMKHQLSERHIPVPTVLIDPWASTDPDLSPDENQLRTDFAASVAAARGQAECSPNPGPSCSAAGPEFDELYRVYAANARALFAYDLPPSSGEPHCALVVASRPPVRPFFGLRPIRESSGWDLPSAVTEIDADHYEIMEASAANAVAEIILARANGRG